MAHKVYCSVEATVADDGRGLAGAASKMLEAWGAFLGVLEEQKIQFQPTLTVNMARTTRSVGARRERKPELVIAPTSEPELVA